MACDPDQHHRRSIRLKGYDYSRVGAYFVTICSHQQRCLFGKISDGQMTLNAYGGIVQDEWTRSAEIRREIELDQFVVMPNHLHGIVFILAPEDRECGRTPSEGDCQSPLQSPVRLPPRNGRFPSLLPRSLSSFVVGFKSAVTRRIVDLRATLREDVWQRNYYEHVIRDEEDLDRIRLYIVNNPLQWDLDDYNPEGRGTNPGATSSRPSRFVDKRRRDRL